MLESIKIWLEIIHVHLCSTKIEEVTTTCKILALLVETLTFCTKNCGEKTSSENMENILVDNSKAVQSLKNNTILNSPENVSSQSVKELQAEYIYSTADNSNDKMLKKKLSKLIQNEQSSENFGTMNNVERTSLMLEPNSMVKPIEAEQGTCGLSAPNNRETSQCGESKSLFYGLIWVWCSFLCLISLYIT